MSATVDHFTTRLLQEVITEAEAQFWDRRAETFEWARPRPGDYLGKSTETDRKRRDTRLREQAEACRARAAVLRRRVA